MQLFCRVKGYKEKLNILQEFAIRKITFSYIRKHALEEINQNKKNMGIL